MLDTERDQKLLVVEDDDVLRGRLSKAMRSRGFETRSAGSVAAAHREIEAGRPNYAVVDLRLPDGNGLEVVEALEGSCPGSRAIILTASGNLPTAVAAARMGATDYIAKPATADEIVDAFTAPAGGLPPPPAETIVPEAARWAHIEHVYHDADNNVSRAARLLGMHRRTLQRTLRRHGVITNETQ